MVRLASSVTRNIFLRSFTGTSLPSPGCQWQMLESHHTHTGTAAHVPRLKITLDVPSQEADNQVVPDCDYRLLHSFCQASKSFKPPAWRRKQSFLHSVWLDRQLDTTTVKQAENVTLFQPGPSIKP